jgi:hypothetical protein
MQGTFTSSNSITFTFSATDDISGVNRVECLLDTGVYSTCSSSTSQSYSALSSGFHVINVRAVDNTGNVGEPTGWTWNVDTTPPTIASTNPAYGATGVSVSSPGFSEPVDSSTITTSTFTLKDSNNNAVSGTVALDGARTTATFTPSQNLAYSTTYTGFITNGVKDIIGN